MAIPVPANDWLQDKSVPDYLRSYPLLEQHFRAQLEGLTTTQKGDKFAHFVRRLLPQTDLGGEFESPQLNLRKSGDEGVDLIAQGRDGQSILYVQAKLWVDRITDIDSV